MIIDVFTREHAIASRQGASGRSPRSQSSIVSSACNSSAAPAGDDAREVQTCVREWAGGTMLTGPALSLFYLNSCEEAACPHDPYAALSMRKPEQSPRAQARAGTRPRWDLELVCARVGALPHSHETEDNRKVDDDRRTPACRAGVSSPNENDRP